MATTPALGRGRADRGPGRLAGAQQAGRPARAIRAAPRAYRLEVELDDNITGFGIRGDRAVTRERRTLRARYRLVDLASGGVVLDATAGSDAGIDVVSSEYATVAAEQTAVERLAEVVADQIVARLGLLRGAPAPARRGEGRPGPASAARSTSPTPQSASICSTAPTKRQSRALGDRLLEGPWRGASSSIAGRRGQGRPGRCWPTKPGR